jgi:hypothetical protein
LDTPASPPSLASPPALYADAPGDIYPRDPRERDLCAKASHPDWLYLGALVAIDAGAFWAGSSEPIKYTSSLPIRFTGPIMIGLAWGATVGGAWLALPKCSPEWVVESPREGRVRETWPLALSLALLAGTTAPIVNAIAFGNCTYGPKCGNGSLPLAWSTFEREMHVVAAGLAGAGGALLPYLIPPRTLAAARELDRIRFGADGRGAFVAYTTTF